MITRPLSSLDQLASLIGVETSTLSRYAQATQCTSWYKEFTVPKRTGGFRLISAPVQELKDIQKKLSNLFLELLSTGNNHIVGPYRPPSRSPLSFSPVENAYPHLSANFVLNIDLSDFFGSIKHPRLARKISEFPVFSNITVATSIAAIACYNGSLPQGSPCSPILSFLVATDLDKKLAHLASRNKCVYSRYVDDITFSSREQEFPVEIAYRNTTLKTRNAELRLGLELNSLIKSEGFEINTAKTRIQNKSTRQEVTGITVNVKLSSSRKLRRHARAMANRLFQHGHYFASYKPGCTSAATKITNINVLEGILSHIVSIDNANECVSNSSIRNLASTFLIYKHFFVGRRSLVVSPSTECYLRATKDDMLNWSAISGIYFLESGINGARRFDRFTPSSHFSSLAGIDQSDIDIARLLNLAVSSYSTFKHAVDNQRDHIFLFKCRSHYRKYLQSIGVRPSFLPLGLVPGTRNLYIGYLGHRRAEFKVAGCEDSEIDRLHKEEVQIDKARHERIRNCAAYLEKQLETEAQIENESYDLSRDNGDLVYDENTDDSYEKDFPWSDDD